MFGIGIALLRGNVTARRVFVAALPFVYVLDGFTFYLQMQVVTGAVPTQTLLGLVISQLLYAILFGWIYVLMFFFYGSKRSDPIFSGERVSSSGCQPQSQEPASERNPDIMNAFHTKIMLIGIVRQLFGIQSTIGLNKATEGLHHECMNNGWDWDGPVHVCETPRLYKFATTRRLAGGSSREPGIVVHINVVTGEVVFSRKVDPEEARELDVHGVIPLRNMFSGMMFTLGTVVCVMLLAIVTAPGFERPGTLKSLVCAAVSFAALGYSLTIGRQDLTPFRTGPWRERGVGVSHVLMILAFCLALAALGVWVLESAG